MCALCFSFSHRDECGPPTSSWFLPDENPRASHGGRAGASVTWKDKKGGSMAVGWQALHTGQECAVSQQKLTLLGSVLGASWPWGPALAVIKEMYFGGGGT